MSSNVIQIDKEEATKGELIETVNGLEAHVEKLEEENEELREKMERMRADMVTESAVNQLIQALVNNTDSVDTSAHPIENRQVLNDFGNRVETMEVLGKQLSSKVESIYDDSVDGKEQAWIKIVEAAQRLSGQQKHTLPNNRVKLHKENIAQATGKSERQARNYIEDFGENKEGADWQPYERPSPSNNRKGKKKALIVDLDVWEEF